MTHLIAILILIAYVVGTALLVRDIRAIRAAQAFYTRRVCK